jgi:hypothetical protein
MQSMGVFSLNHDTATLYRLGHGCGMQSMGVCSLYHYHDTKTSYRLDHTPFPLKFTPTCTCYGVRHKGAPICPSTVSQGAKTLCIHPIWMWDAVNELMQLRQSIEGVMDILCDANVDQHLSDIS